MSSSSLPQLHREEDINCVTYYESKKFKFTWTISDFSIWISDIKEYRESACFPSDGQIQWCLRFHPEYREDKSFCSLYLICKKRSGDPLNTKFKFTLMDANKTVFNDTRALEYKFEDVLGYGFLKLVERSFLLEKTKNFNTLIITCEINAKVRLVNRIMPPNTVDQSSPPSTIADDFTKLMEGQQFGDFSIKVGDKKYRVYKGILASRSSVFAAMFENKMQEKIKNFVTIVDVEPDVFYELLRYIYTDKVQNLDTMAYQLFAAADKYDIQPLKTLCRMSILGNLSTENATEALQCADLHQDNEMKSRTLEFLRNNVGQLVKVTESAGWKELEDSYPHLVTEVLKTIAKQ